LIIRHSGNPKIDKNKKSLKEIIQIILDSPSFQYDNYATQLMNIKLKSGQEMEICLILMELCFEHNEYNEILGSITQVKLSVHSYQ